MASSAPARNCPSSEGRIAASQTMWRATSNHLAVERMTYCLLEKINRADSRLRLVRPCKSLFRYEFTRAWLANLEGSLITRRHRGLV
jgi:hypothetical protein